MQVHTKEMKFVVTKVTLFCDKCNDELKGADSFKIEVISSWLGATENLDLCEECTDEAVKLLENSGFKFNNHNT